ncbi:hypothetical protein [Yoonia sp. R2-816]|uniref:hypothetical protein n=1 Tax=Yoonia sp. R2-816 TaxID=3342638 RepID=UPI00372782D0
MNIGPQPLYDWQDDVDAEIIVALEVLPDRVDVIFPEKEAHVWIEYEDGRIRVHCYHQGKDEPVNIEIHKDRIEIDTEDYDR